MHAIRMCKISEPKTVFKHKECEPYLQEAQQEVIRRMSNFDDDTGLTETMNQAAREYHTVLKNGVWMNFTKWQTKFVIAELRNTELPKAVRQFVIKKILQIANRASKGPNASNYKSKLVVSHGVPFMELEGDAITKRLEATMLHIPETKDSKDWYGRTVKSHILKNVALFLQAGVLMVRRMLEIRKEGDKMPPIIIPQLKYKVRAVTFGKEQTVELCRYLESINRHHDLLDPAEIPMKKKIERPTIEIEKAQTKRKREEIFKPNKRQKTSLTKAQWRDVADIVFPRIFIHPKRLRKKGVNVVTTDGISASWHVGRSKSKPSEKYIKGVIPPGEYGTHGKDTFFTCPDATVIAVDPGHATIISLVRENKDEMSKLEIKNTTWRSWNGNMRNQQKVQVFNDRYDGMRDAIATLSKSPSGDLTKYRDHIEARLSTPVFVRAMKLKCKRRWGFDSYRQEQRAVHKLAAAVLGGESNVVVAWGNGSFGPTSNGHASAPNKALRRSLSRFFPIVLVDEYNTSKKTHCCEQHARQLRTPNYKERTTVVQCPKCKTLLSRDTNAAKNILKVFRTQEKNQNAELPEYLRRKKHFGVPTMVPRSCCVAPKITYAPPYKEC